MANFSGDLLPELLSLLPTNSLLRFMCVSKSWYYLIKSFYFFRIHHLKQQELYQTRYFSPRMIGLKDYQLYFINFSSNADFRYTKISNIPSKNLKIKEFESCNGVLCLHCTYRKVVIWNPLSHKYKELHSPIAQPDSEFAFGFGYDRVTGDYKLIALQVFLDGTNIHDDIVPRASVYSVKSGSWKHIDGFNYRLHNMDSGVFLRDSVHWLTKSKSIVAFDLTTDQFHEIPLPSFCCSSLIFNISCMSVGVPGCSRLLTNIRYMNIGVLSDCLTLTCRDNSTRKEALFAMKSYGTKDSWENLRLNLSGLYTYNMKPIACMGNGIQMILRERIYGFILYNTKNQSGRKHNFLGEAHSYIATLGFYGGKLDDAGEEGGKTKRVSKALPYRTSNKRVKV